MTAKNPYKASDLIKKYGWLIMPSLSNLGITLYAEAAVLFVDSNHAEASDTEDERHGHTPDRPFATLDYAVGMCTADKGDIILVAPYHAETLSGAADLNIDVSGITIIGIGSGSAMPTFTLGGTAADTTIEINGDNITVSNLRIVGGDTDGTTRAIDIKTGSDYVTLDGLHFFETDNTLEILGCITLEDKTDQCTIRNCVFLNLSSGDNTDAIFTEADEHDFLVIEGCTFIGDWTNAVIDIDASDINYPLIKDCLIVNYDETSGDAIDLGSATKLVMVNLRVASGDPNAYPVADITSAFQIGCHACEKGLETVAFLGSATATSWAG